MRLFKSLVLCFELSLSALLSASSASFEAPLLWQPLNEPGTGGRIDSIVVNPYDPNHVLVGGDVLGAHLSMDQGDRWSGTSGWMNYEISDFTWHPQHSSVIWAGSLSGPHLSTDGGKTWTVKRRGFPPVDSGNYSAPVEKVLFDPDGSGLFAFGGDHRQLHTDEDVKNYGVVWLSDDEGESWQRISEIVRNGNIMAASYAGSSNYEIYAAVWNHGVFYSRDDGKNWRKRNEGLPVDENGHIPIASLVTHPDNPQIAWVAIDNFGLYRTTNGGEQWQLLNQNIPTEGTTFWSIAVDQSGQTLYAGNRNYNNSRRGVYKSTDGGNSWQRQFFSVEQIKEKNKPYPGGINPWWVELDPASSDVVYAGTDNAVYRSVDGGESWTVLTAKLTSQGWQGTGFSGLVSRNIEWNPEDASHLVLQGKDAARAIQSWDSGRHWRVENPGMPPYDGGHDVAFAPGWMFGVFGQGGDENELIARSQDAGRSWTVLTSPVSPAVATDVHVDEANPNRLWVVVNGQLWYCDNATQTSNPNWTRVVIGTNDNTVGDIEAVPSQGDAFYIATDAGIYYSMNGAEFRLIGGPKDASNTDLAIAPSSPNVLYAARDKSYGTDDDGLWRYDLSTDDWSRVWHDDGDASEGPRSVTASIGDLAVHPNDANILAVVTNDFPFHDETWATGVWISRDAGKTWRQENRGLPMLRGDAIAFHPDGNKLVVGLRGAGFYITDFEPN